MARGKKIQCDCFQLPPVRLEPKYHWSFFSLSPDRAPVSKSFEKRETNNCTNEYVRQTKRPCNWEHITSICTLGDAGTVVVAPSLLFLSPSPFPCWSVLAGCTCSSLDGSIDLTTGGTSDAERERERERVHELPLTLRRCT